MVHLHIMKDSSLIPSSVARLVTELALGLLNFSKGDVSAVEACNLWCKVTPLLSNARRLPQSTQQTFPIIEAVHCAFKRLEGPIKDAVMEQGKKCVQDHGLKGPLVYMKEFSELSPAPPCVSVFFNLIRSWTSISQDSLNARNATHDHQALLQSLPLFVRLGSLSCPWLAEVAMEKGCEYIS